MSRSAAIPLAFFVAVLLIGGLFIAGLDEDPAEIAASAASLEARVLALEQEVEQLRAEVRRLGGELSTSGRTPGALALRGSTAPTIEARPPVALERAQVGGQEALRRIIDSDDPQVREQFQSLVRDELDVAREERWERRMQRRTERRSAQLERLAADVQLGGDQLAALQGLLEDESEQISDLFRAAREDMSFDEARTAARELREATDEEVGGLLSEEQYSAWQAMRQEERGGRGR